MDHIENDASSNSSIVVSVFVAAITVLPRRCLATMGGYTHRHTDCFMKYAKFHKDWFRNSKVNGGGNT
jgi:hypothetical protein